MESPRKTSWWVIGIAAVLAVLLLFYSTGTWAGFGLCIAGIVALLLWQVFRTGKASSVRCMKCGQKLNPNARQCESCGSASWTVN
jgi:hypothetical protein